MITPELLAAGLVVVAVLLVLVLVVLLRRQGAESRAMFGQLALLQRGLEVSQRGEADAVRATLADTERASMQRGAEGRLELQTALGGLTTQLVREQGEQRVLMEAKLREMADQAALGLAEIRRSVDETLTASIEKQMAGSFQRVIDQFTAVQKAMLDVQAVTADIGDLKRIFTNVKTRGAWGEMQLRALLEDVLPHGAWEANRKLRVESDEVVEFVLLMPSRAEPRPVLAIDAKFPAEDYDRLLQASETGDVEAERVARRGLEMRFRGEAKKIGSKYVVPPATVDFAIMYLPTDGLYVEAARMPGLIESLNREHRVLVMGPTLMPALLRTVQLGALTLQIERRAEDIGRLLGAVRTEFGRMDLVLGKLEKQAGSVSNTIVDARRRTRAMDRTLKDVTRLAVEEAAAALALERALDTNTEGPGS